jgi:hypothetical protein
VQFKDLLGLALILIGTTGGAVAACLSYRLRDVFVVVMVFLAPMTEFYDVNFVSRDWYRGTLRGFEFSLVDILSLSLLAGCLLVPRRGQSRFYWPASLGLILLFFLYCSFNVAIAEPKLFGLFELSKMVRGLVIFLAVALYVQSERELRILLLALGLVVCYEGYEALKQRYVYGIHRVWGTIADSNSLSVFFCTTAPVFVAAFNARLPRYLKILAAAAIALSVVGMILTISRAGVVILGAVLVGATLLTMSYRVTGKKLVIGLVILLGAAGVLAKSWKTLQSRFQESNLEQEYAQKNNMGRGYYLRLARAIASDHIFGVGLNNWSYWVSSTYGPKLGYRFVPYRGPDKPPSTVIPSGANVDAAQAAPAHNLGALTLGELGLPGLVLFAFLWMRWFQMGAVFLWRRSTDPMRMIGIGILMGFGGLFLQSITEWVFRQSPIYYVFNILLGTLAGLYYVRRRELRSAEAQPNPGDEEEEDAFEESHDREEWLEPMNPEIRTGSA